MDNKYSNKNGIKEIFNKALIRMEKSLTKRVYLRKKLEFKKEYLYRR